MTVRSEEPPSAFMSKLHRSLLGIRPVELALLLKNLLRVRRAWRDVGDLKFWIDPCTNFGQRLITTGVYDPEVTHAIQGLLRPGDCFIDLGGNEGYFSIIAGRCVGPTGHVFCIEPQARLWPVIVNNLNANAISCCTLVTDAVSDASGSCDLTLAPSLNSGASRLGSSVRGKLYPKQRVELISLDQLLAKFNIDRVQAIKIDIEGLELNALRSGIEALSQKVIKNLLVEIHPEQLAALRQSPDELLSLMAGLGYTCTKLGDMHLFRG